jgi:hypothetical protein
VEISKELLKRASTKDEYYFLKEFIKTQMYTVMVEDFFNKHYKLNDMNVVVNLSAPDNK